MLVLKVTTRKPMIIGLVRHFKVAYRPASVWMTSEQFQQWVLDYDRSDLLVSNFNDNQVDWEVCICSDLWRAANTAKIIYNGTIHHTPQLREIDMRSLFQTNMKLHYYLWQAFARIAWYYAHQSQTESRKETLLRAQYIVDEIEANYTGENILVVSHGAFMKYVSLELRRRGYDGISSIKPENGRLYIFTKPSS